jgi:short-subunit dehydrogenase
MAVRTLDGAVVVITGASSGIGRATAHRLARHRARLVLAARRGDTLDGVARECAELGGSVQTVPTDIGDLDAVARLGAAARARFGRIDVWVQCAANVVVSPFGREDPDELRRLIVTNLLGTMFCSRVALEVYREQGHGVLINVSSLLGVVPNPLAAAYVASKFAVRGLSLSLRQAVVGSPGIDVCVVLPGPVDTPLFEHAANRTGRRLRAIPPAYAPERVAAAIVECARRPRRQVTVGVLSHLILLLGRIAPAVTELAVAQFAARAVTTSDPAPPASGALFEPPSSGRVQGGYRRGALRRRVGSWIGATRGAGIRP